MVTVNVSDISSAVYLVADRDLLLFLGNDYIILRIGKYILFFFAFVFPPCIKIILIEKKNSKR